MRIRSTALLIVVVLVAAIGFGIASAETQSYRGVAVSASTIDMYPTSNKIVASGKAHIEADDKAAKTSFEADASKITVILTSQTDTKVKDKSGLSAVKSAELAGPVKMTYITVEPTGVTTKTTATADKATFDGVEKMARLEGSVKVINDNPAVFDEPAVMTGDRALINLNPILGPNDFRFRIESSPGVSRIEATPRK